MDRRGLDGDELRPPLPDPPLTNIADLLMAESGGATQSEYYENLVRVLNSSFIPRSDPSANASPSWPLGSGLATSDVGPNMTAMPQTDSSFPSSPTWSYPSSTNSPSAFPDFSRSQRHGDPYLPSSPQHDVFHSPESPVFEPAGQFAPYWSAGQGVRYSGQDLPHAADAGHELYAEAMRQWSSPDTPPYDPLAGPPVFPESPLSPSSPLLQSSVSSGAQPNGMTNLAPNQNADVPSTSCNSLPQMTKVNCLPQTSQMPVQTRPTYSDIAKHKSAKPKSKSVDDKCRLDKEFVAHQDSPIVRGQNSTPRHRTPVHRKHNMVHSAPVSSKTTKFNFEPPVIKPNSRFGLDMFDEPLAKNHRVTSTPSAGDSSGKAQRRESDPPRTKTSISEPQRSCDPTHESPPEQNPAPRQSEPTKNPPCKQTPPEATKDKIFFDPKRIFATKKPKKPSCTTSQAQNNRPSSPDPDSSLNNGKPSVQSNTSSGHFDQTCYINNDLSKSTKKKSNVEADSTSPTDPPEHPKSSSLGKKKARPVHSSRSTKKSKHIWYQQLETYSSKLWTWLSCVVPQIFAFLWHSVIKTIIALVLIVVLLLIQYSCKLASWCWRLLRSKLEASGWKSAAEETSKRPTGRHGLKANIGLPVTGDEAMQRLLACKGKDPYSILGVCADATDEEIKRYYRKQAFLVHPDKNKQPGAEESFKILSHAFELIGNPEKRRLYDTQQVRHEASDTAMQEFADLLNKLQEKVQEAANQMRCDNCGGKHKRVCVDRPLYAARYCSKCRIHHSVKEGDMWAESQYMGFLWHYYCCMEGKVYDVTAWASCQDKFGNIQSNAHNITYRLSSTAGRPRQPTARSNEAELDDFLSQLFHHGQDAAGRPGQFPSGHHPSDRSGRSTGPRKGGMGSNRKKKKKH